MGLVAGSWIKTIQDTSSLHVLSCDELRRVQELIYDIALDIYAFCDVYGLSLMLGGGSCLGAVRHNGFIPWDDDIDLNLMRSEYNIFADHFPQLFEDKYTVQIPGKTPNYYMPMIRVRLKGTIARDIFEPGADEAGLFVDVHPVENIPDNVFLRLLQGSISLSLMYLMTCKRYYHYSWFYRKMSETVSDELIETIKTKICIGRILNVVPCKPLAKAIQLVNGGCRNNHSKYVAIPAGRKFYFGEIAKRSVHVPPAECTFQNLRWKIPQDADSYLSNLYGDYMRIPEESDREHHFFIEFDLGNYSMNTEVK